MRFAFHSQSERARLRVGRSARASLAPRPFGPGSCAARDPRAAPPLGLALPARRCASSPMLDLDMLAVAPPLGRRHDAPRVAPLLGAVHARLSLPTRSLAITTVVCRWRASVVPAKPWVGVRWRDLCGAEERRSRGRARSALRLLTRRDCSSAANAVSVASFATGHESEHHRKSARSAGRRITSDAAHPPAALPVLACAANKATIRRIAREFPPSQGLHRRRFRASDAQGARQDRRATACRVCGGCAGRRRVEQERHRRLLLLGRRTGHGTDVDDRLPEPATCATPRAPTLGGTVVHLTRRARARRDRWRAAATSR